MFLQAGAAIIPLGMVLLGAEGLTIRRLMDVFLLEPVSRHFTYTPVRTVSLTHAWGIGPITKNWGDCSGVTRHPFHMHSLYRSDCLSISAHVCTEMHMNICVCVCLSVCTHLHLPACMYMFYRHFSVFIHHCDILIIVISPSWSWEIKQLESYWERMAFS